MTSELCRLTDGPQAQEQPGGMGTVRFIVICNGNAGHVLALAKKTLMASIELADDRCFDESKWAVSLPSEFVQNCPPFPSDKELGAYHGLSLEEREILDQKSGWPLRAFMNSFREDILKRYWSWWDAAIVDDSHIALAVEVDEWPFPSESLRWLFRGSGAIEVESEP